MQGTPADRRNAVLQGTRRRSPRASDSCDMVDISAPRIFRKSVPVSAEQRLHSSATAVVTSAATSAAAAAAAAGRVDRPRLAHPGAEQAAARAPSPATATAHRPTARSNRSSDLRMARRDTAASSRPIGQLWFIT